MTAILVAATLLAGPALPDTHGDHFADEVRLEIVHQIRAHQDYVDHMHDVWRHRRQEAARARTVPTVPSVPVSDGSWADELAAVGFPPEAIPTMLYIIQRESGGDPSAMNPSGACGLTQIYPYVPGCLDPMTNLRLAFEKYQASGFAPWAMG